MRGEIGNDDVVRLAVRGFETYSTRDGIVLVSRERLPTDGLDDAEDAGGYLIVRNLDIGKLRTWLRFRNNQPPFPPGELTVVEQRPAARDLQPENADQAEEDNRDGHEVTHIQPDFETERTRRRRADLRGVIAVLVLSGIGALLLGQDLLSEHTVPASRGVREVTYWGFFFVVVLPILMLLTLVFLVKEEDVHPLARIGALLDLASYVGLLVFLAFDEARVRLGWDLLVGSDGDQQVSATTAEATEAGIRSVIDLVPLIDLAAFGWDDPVEDGSTPFGLAVWSVRILVVLAVGYPVERYAVSRFREFAARKPET